MPRTHVSLLKPIETCMPSQKGLFFDAPQRHSVTRLRTSYSKPSAPTTCTPPRSHIGPRHTLTGSSTSPIERGYAGSNGLPVALSHATSRPEGQSQVWRSKCARAAPLSVSFTRFHTEPLGSQKRADAHRLSTSVNDIVGPFMSFACSR